MTIEEMAIAYHLVFDIGGEIDPIRTMRAFLGSDLSVTGTNYLTGDIEHARRTAALGNLYREADLLIEFEQQLNQGSSALLKWLAVHPSIALRLVHYSVLRRIWRRNPEPEPESDGRSHGQRMEDTKRLINDSMTNAQLYEKIQYGTDRRLFSPIYLHQVPFCRVTLQPFETTLNGVESAVDVDVLFHRSGTAILRFLVLRDRPATLSEAIEMQLPIRVAVGDLRAAKMLFELQNVSYGVKSKVIDSIADKIEFSGGIEWLTVPGGDGQSLADVLLLYRLAIIAVLHGGRPEKVFERDKRLRSQDWFIYPVVFARKVSPKIPTAQQFKRIYRRELAGFVGRIPNWHEFDSRLLDDTIARDYSNFEDESFFVGPGNAAVVYFGAHLDRLNSRFGEKIPGQEWIVSHLNRSTLVEAALIQKWILETIRQQIRTAPQSVYHLNAIRRILVHALEEYHSIAFAYGTANDIVKAARKEIGVEDDYDAVMKHLANLGTLVETEESRVRMKRDQMLRVAGSIATVLLGIPSANQVTSVLVSWSRLPPSDFPSTGGQSLRRLTDWTAGHQIATTLIVYVSILIAVVFVNVWRLIPNRSTRPVVAFDASDSAARRGFTWPKSPVIIFGGDDKENSDADHA